MEIRQLRLSAWTRPLTYLSVAALRASPFVVFAVHSRLTRLVLAQWEAIFSVCFSLLCTFFMVERRCASPDLPYRHGLLVVGASMTTGILFADLFAILFAVSLAQLASIFVAMLPDPDTRYRRLVGLFYRHRLRR